MDNIRDIIAAVKSGDASAFDCIVKEFSGKAYSLTLRILTDREEAEDSLQDSFLKLYRAIAAGQFEERSKLSTYFYTVVYNTAADHYKRLKNKRFNVISIDVDSDNFEEGDDLAVRIERNQPSDAEKSADESEISEIVRKYVSVLPEHYSVILTMFYINGLSHDEISEILRLPVGTVKNRIFRAKARLKELILQKFSKEEILQYI